jgi:putative heme degradation protein
MFQVTARIQTDIIARETLQAQLEAEDQRYEACQQQSTSSAEATAQSDSRDTLGQLWRSMHKAFRFGCPVAAPVFQQTPHA